MGSPVLYYVVEHSDPDDISMYILRTRDLTATSYTLDHMRPVTTYIIRVSVRNSVSDQDPQNAARRIVGIDTRTKEGRKISMCKLVNCHTTYSYINLSLYPPALPAPPPHWTFHN